MFTSVPGDHEYANEPGMLKEYILPLAGGAVFKLLADVELEVLVEKVMLLKRETLVPINPDEAEVALPFAP